MNGTRFSALTAWKSTSSDTQNEEKVSGRCRRTEMKLSWMVWRRPKQEQCAATSTVCRHHVSMCPLCASCAVVGRHSASSNLAARQAATIKYAVRPRFQRGQAAMANFLHFQVQSGGEVASANSTPVLFLFSFYLGVKPILLAIARQAAGCER